MIQIAAFRKWHEIQYRISNEQLLVNRIFCIKQRG